MSVVTMVSVIAEAVAILATIAVVMRYFGSLGTRVDVLEKANEANKVEHKDICDITYGTQREVSGLKSSVESIKEVVFRIDDKIDRMNERGNK